MKIEIKECGYLTQEEYENNLCKVLTRKRNKEEKVLIDKLVKLALVEFQK